MLEGAYTVSVVTPLGTKHGIVYLVEDGHNVLMKIVMDEQEAKLKGELAQNDDTFVIVGATTLKGRDISFKIIGSVAGDTLNAQIITSTLTLRATGRRIG